MVCRSRLETRRHAGGSRSGPIPETEPVDQPPSSDRTGERIAFAATLGKSGKLNGLLC